jgi:glucose/mannose-6-phosphate isomerase
MKEILRTYNEQFKFQPEIVNEHLVRKNFKQIVLCGMGGSHLAAGILKTIEPGIDIYVHKDYDIPPYSKAFLESSLLVASSYSGNTEEVLSFYNKIKQLYDLPVLCISLGGQLLELAQKNNDPYITLPKTEFVPRTALGITSIALACLFKNKDIFYKLQNLEIDISTIEQQAENIALSVKDKIPVFYSSNQNIHLSYNWKIKCNETAKQAAFYNVFPEANHNELEGYEYIEKNSNIVPILLKDRDDHIRTQKRFDIFENILKEKQIEYVSIDISNIDMYKKVFNTIILGDFVSARVAELQGYPQAQVPLIEAFKNKLV